jgi:hypothetical protein
MLKYFYGTIAASFLALGALHMSLTVPIYGTLTMPALWFAGTGLLLMAVAVLNWIVIRTRAQDGPVALAVAAMNAAGLIFAGLVLRVLPEPQTYLLLGLFAAATGMPGLLRRARLRSLSRTDPEVFEWRGS